MDRLFGVLDVGLLGVERLFGVLEIGVLGVKRVWSFRSWNVGSGGVERLFVHWTLECGVWRGFGVLEVGTWGVVV